MAFRLSAAARNAACNGVVDLLDAGTTPVIEIYTGSQPADPDTAASGTLLARFNMNGTAAFGSASAGVATLADTPISTTGLAAGTAGYFRMLTQTSGTAVCDGTVGTSGSNLNLNTTTISVGVTVEITSGTVTMPQGA